MVRLAWPCRSAVPRRLARHLDDAGRRGQLGDAHAAYGRLPLARCLDSAITYARDGIPVTERLAGWIGKVQADLAPHAETMAVFMPGGHVPRPGSRLRNPDLARTLAHVAADAAAGFYQGEVGADLAAQTARWGEPLQGRYRDVTLYETPAPTQGFTVLQMLTCWSPSSCTRVRP